MQGLHLTALAIGSGVMILVVALALYLRRPTKRSKEHGAKTHGPANLRYICARCSNQETHTKRTLSAWEKGNRKFFCNSCHKRWREAQPPQEQQNQTHLPSVTKSKLHTRDTSPSRHFPVQSGLVPKQSGCLTVIFVIAVIPTAIAIISAYAS